MVKDLTVPQNFKFVGFGGGSDAIHLTLVTAVFWCIYISKSHVNCVFHNFMSGKKDLVNFLFFSYYRW